jgi:multiple sugar transport system substrate-binding protein
VQPADAEGATGSVTTCGHSDASGVNGGTAAAFMEQNPDVQAKYVEIGANTDQSRTQQVQRLEGQSSECDVFLMDVTWVSEFATQNWLLDQTAVVEGLKDEIIPATLDTAFYEGKYWATPFYTNASLIYYAPDKVAKPETWQQLYEEAGKGADTGFVYQGQQYEGLTVNFLEMLYSAGGSVLDEDGNITIDSPETREVLDLMASGIESGAAPRGVLTFDEDATRIAYESGNYGYERNWPNVYRALKQTPLADQFAVAPLPAWEGGEAGGVLGGWNMAISAYSENPEAAVAFINFAASPEWQKRVAADYSQAPVNEAAYDDPEVLAAMPFAQELRESVENAKPRPKSPVYPQISQAIYDNVYSVISGEADSETAVRKMVEGIEAAQETF